MKQTSSLPFHKKSARKSSMTRMTLPQQLGHIFESA